MAVRELEAPVSARGCLAVKTAHRVRDLHIGVCYCASRRILHHSFNRAGISSCALLGVAQSKYMKLMLKTRKAIFREPI